MLICGDDVIGSLLYAIETTVVEWSNQINEILAQDSGQPVAEGQAPMPMYEYDFWNQRMTCMHDIYDQLVHPKVKKMASILEEHQSAYAAPFKEMFKKVVRAVVESETIVAFLTPLINYLGELENTQFDEVKPSIQPIVHILALIWVNCEYYRKTERMVIIITEIGNLLIQQARLFLDPSECIKEEPEEAMKKLNKSIEIFKHFRKVVEDYRTNVKESCNEQNVEPSEWVFHSSWVFGRVDAFVERLEMIRAYFLTNIDYNRLEKVEALGVVGAVLSSRLAQIYEEYLEAYKKFTDASMDCLSTDDDTFLNALKEYNKTIEQFDHRLCTIILKSFMHSGTVCGMFKTIYMYGPLLERPLIAPSFEPCYKQLLEGLHGELDECKLVLDSHLDDETLMKKAICKSLPPSAGAMVWCLQILRRAQAAMKPLKHVDHP
ncbi:unnamed protein product [Dibothriocephalus latus]|uniref:Dynein heavy chain tail domain-containing protein n=1 Tax=Dibothriocephalus latus TaxID=60516 RepID=A0A3P7NZ47_DIBLA|nr:unnamed protein product [Dibothriocephalus latus]